MKANYHCHTERCGHAVGADEEYVQAAVRSGFDILGIADHGPWPFASGYVSHMRLPLSGLGDYLASIRTLQQKYEGQITLHAGFEMEYYPRYIDHLRRLHDAGVEYFILGQHQLDTEEENPYIGRILHTEDGVLRYADTVCRGLRTGLYSYIAHPDLFMISRPVDDFTPACEQATVMIAQAAKEADVPLEMNMLGAWEKRHYPNDHFWRLAVKYHNQAIIGVDAHTPAALERNALWDSRMQYLKDLGYHVQETLTFKEV